MRLIQVALVLWITSFSVARAECVVISGLPEDDNGAFWDFKDEITACKVYRDFDQLLAAGLKGKAIDLHVIAHGQKDGSVICQKTESPSEIVIKLNQLAKANQVFAAFDSCYSDQILKEKVLFDTNTKPEENNLLHQSCFYSAATSKNQALIDEVSFADFRFLDKKALNGKTVLELYRSTGTGLLSAAPFDGAGITEYWASNGVTVSDKKTLKAFQQLKTKGLPTEKCLALEMCVKLAPEIVFEISAALTVMKNMAKELSWTEVNTEKYVRSFERLTAENSHDSLFLKSIIEDDVPSFKDFKKACESHPTELFCQLSYVNYTDFAYLNALFKIRNIQNEMGVVQKNSKSIFPDDLSVYALEVSLLKSLKEKKGYSFNACSKGALLGDLTHPQIKYSGLDGKKKLNWGSILGTFSRLSVEMLAAGDSLSVSKNDQARFNACKNFSFDPKGELTFTAHPKKQTR